VHLFLPFLVTDRERERERYSRPSLSISPPTAPQHFLFFFNCFSDLHFSLSLDADILSFVALLHRRGGGGG